MKALLITLCLAILLATCSTPHQGIRVRAQSPSLEEAFGKFSLALTLDGYSLAVDDPVRHEIVTSWRELTGKERPDTTRVNREESRIFVRMERRGRLYDIDVTPMVRTDGGNGSVADLHHPLREKWQRILHTLVEKEAREGD